MRIAACLALLLLGCSASTEDAGSDEAALEANRPKILLRTPTREDGSALPAKITTKTRVKFSVKATDDTAVARVELYDVRGLVATDTTGTHTGTYELVVDIGASHTGIDTFYAVAVDTSGNTRVSTTVALDVDITGATSDSLAAESAASTLLDATVANTLDGKPEPDVLAFGARAASYIPPKLEASPTTRLRHSMPATLSKLSLAYTLLDQKNALDDCERLSILRVAAQHAERLYGVNEIQKGRVVGNVALRQAFSLHAAGLLLTKEMPKASRCTSRAVAACPTCAATGAKVLAAATTATSLAFDPTISAVFVNIRDDGHYAEGYGYSNFALEAIVPDAVVRNRYEGVNIFTSPLIEGQRNRLPSFLNWFALSQRMDGTWTGVNDSGGVENMQYIEPMMSLTRAAGGGTYANLHRAWCRAKTKDPVSDRLARALDAGSSAGWTADSCSARPPGEALYPNGGHVHLRNAKIGLSTSAFNEGAWYRKSTREDWASIITNATSDSDRYLPLFFFDFPGRPEAPAAPIASNDFSWVSKLTASTADKAGSQFWHYKEYNHRRFDDGHFEISAFGKNLLIGPGFSPYDLLQPVDEFRMPRSHNLLEVNGVYAKTDLAAVVKAERLVTSAGAPGVYHLPTDLYDRYLVDGEGRFTIVFDRIKPTAVRSLVARYHGRDAFSTSITQKDGAAEYRKATWSFAETLRNGTVLPGADPSIKLHAYWGLPQTHVAAGREEGVDGCDDVLYTAERAKTIKLSQFCRHDVLTLENVGAKNVRAVPILFWPEGPGAWGQVKPTVTWDANEDAAGNVDVVTLRVAYTRPDGSVYDETFRFAFTGALPTKSTDLLAP